LEDRHDIDLGFVTLCLHFFFRFESFVDSLFDGSSDGLVGFEFDIPLLFSIFVVGLAPFLVASGGLSPLSELILLPVRELLVFSRRIIA
jgi:hypothetical protein